MKKRKLVWLSNYPVLKTGLARNTRAVIEYLYKTDKFDITVYSQGMPYENPEYLRFPYKVIGCLPNNPQEMENINKDQNYARFAQYGGHLIDKVIQEEKPDLMVFSDDPWAHPYLEKPWFSKFPCIYHITIDSTPVLEEAFKQAARTPYYTTWTDFCNKYFHQRGLNHVFSIPGAIDPQYFYKLPGFQKIELREKFNIPRDSFICGFVFRNQLRKEVGPLMEGYALWKKQNSQIKNTFLLLHTHFSEPCGWDIPRFCDTYEINKSEILTTYICKNCKEIEIKQFIGQDVNCRFCGAPGLAPTQQNPGGSGQITCNINFGCTEEQLNEVYNLMDCYCHLMNAGGLEFPIAESLYCELPTATVAYSSGETFTKNDFVFTIENSWTHQLGTQFDRACPYPASVAKFLNKIYNLENKKRQEIGRKSREWAISKFSPKVVGKQWEDFLDSIPDHNYDFSFKEELKNPDFPMPELENDEDWITSLYNNILKCQPDDEGKKNWLNGLKSGQSRKQIYDFFVDLARKSNGAQENNNQQVSLEQIFPRVGDKKNVLLVLPGSLGDHIILKNLLPNIYQKYPPELHTIYLAADPKYFEIHQDDPNLKLIQFNPIFRAEMVMIGAAGNGPIDHFLDLAVSTQIHLNYLSNEY